MHSLACVVSSGTLRIITMSKSLYRLLIYIEIMIILKFILKLTIFPNLITKSVNFPVTGEVMLFQSPVICR